MESKMLPYDYVDRPQHYLIGDVETFDLIVQAWGKEAAILFCEISSFKYRMRMGKKPGQDPMQDFQKINWFERKIGELKYGDKYNVKEDGEV